MEKDTWDRKFLLIGFGISLLLWLTVGNTPESTEKTFQYISGLIGYNFYIQPGYDVPSLYPLIAMIWILTLLANTMIIYYQAFKSDMLYIPGMKHPVPCIANRLTTTGPFAMIRRGSIKPFAIEGSDIVITPATHTHRIGPNNIVMDANVIPKRSLLHVPITIQEDVIVERGGLFGVDTCSTGRLTTEEEQNHPTCTYLNKKMNTKTFLNKVDDINFSAGPVFEIFRGDENTAVTKILHNIVRIGKGITFKEPTLKERIFGGN